MVQAASSSPDPRLLSDFEPSHLPLCDGAELPSLHTGDRHQLLMIEFANVYYRMNEAIELAEKARLANDAEAERVALEQLCSASDARDALEDRCAPEGFFAEPIMRGGRYADLQFMWAGKKPGPRVYVRQFKAEFTFDGWKN